ncbi:7-cyano-7-deazaguanine synthase QueC [Alloalcanivorax sp. C16-1]|uniref:7-cyano-7-deazaguanine synthase QueC n=1 Tax=Alloalcanivorax sp. C16-1 TaxID=3390051 RepID=UPI003970F2E2
MNTAVVLLSGGLDSATCLAIARHQGYRCHTIAFDYGQRTRSELDAAARVSRTLGAESHRVIELGLGAIGGSALTDHAIEVPEEGGDGIPITYVPARNTVFLSLALGLAEVVDASAIYIGVNAVDYSGYPDCRPEFIDAFQTLAGLATKAGVEGHPIEIATPLMHLSKADIIRRGTELGLDYGLTVSCYQADADGRACGRCDSCRLRRQGFEEALIKDPTIYQ